MPDTDAESASGSGAFALWRAAETAVARQASTINDDSFMFNVVAESYEDCRAVWGAGGGVIGVQGEDGGRGGGGEERRRRRGGVMGEEEWPKQTHNHVSSAYIRRRDGRD